MRFSRAQAAQLILGSGAGGPMIIIGVAPIPAELVTYYAAGAPVTKTAPETMVGVTIYYDGQNPQNYLYEGMVVDSSATKITSRVTGANVGGTVNEMMRAVLNPGAVLGGGRFIEWTEESNTIHTSANLATTVFATQKPADAFHRWSINTQGTQGWGTGAALTDVYLAYNGSNTGLEIGQSLRLRGFGNPLFQDVIIVLKDGDTVGRFFVQLDGTLFWGPGGAANTDVTFGRTGVGLLSTPDSDIAVSLAGKGFQIKEGTNAKMGTGTLVAGSLVVNTTAVTANSRVFAFCQTPGGTPGFLRQSARVNGTSFTILSSNAADTSTFAWLLFEPA